MRKAIIRLKVKMISDKNIADLIDTNPEAIGRNCFFGCFLSSSLSITSLIKYMEEEMKQKEIKPLKLESHI